MELVEEQIARLSLGLSDSRMFGPRLLKLEEEVPGVFLSFGRLSLHYSIRGNDLILSTITVCWILKICIHCRLLSSFSLPYRLSNYIDRTLLSF